MTYSNEKMMKIYETMLRGRIYDDVLYEENQKGHLYSMFHFSKGQEAIGTSVAMALRDDEPFMPSHRCRPLGMYRMELYPYLSEQCGSKQGYHKGISGDPHLTMPEKGFLSNPGVLGQACPIATGYAYALKYFKTGKAMAQLMGDGTFNQGAVYEALNWAVVQKLPIVYIVENNAFAMSTVQSHYVGTEALADRAKGVGMDVVTIDGNDVLAMMEAMEVALKRAREQSTPTLIEAVTYRITGHFAGDPAQYRNNEWHEEMLAKHPDPIARFEKILLDNHIATQEDFDRIKEATINEFRDACQRVYEDRQNPENIITMEEILAIPNLVYTNAMEELR